MIEGLQASQLIGDPWSGDSFYALTPAGLYITRDGGLNWAQVTPTPLQDEFVFSPAEPGILYAGTGPDCYRDAGQPLYKSINGGATWSALPYGFNLRPVAVHPADPQQLWAIGCAGPTYSSDAGDTWTTSSSDLFLIYDVSQVVPAGDDWSVIYLGGVSEGGSGIIARSQDGGESWTTLLQDALERPLWWINDLLVLPSAQIFLAAPHGVWRSRDGGNSWDLFNAGLEDVIYQDDADFVTTGLNALLVDSSTTPQTIYLGTAQGVYHSLDEGETWVKLKGAPWENAPIRSLALSSPGLTRRLFITTDAGVYVRALVEAHATFPGVCENSGAAASR